jgi:hypothetical protein
VLVHALEQGLAQIVLLEQMPEVQDGGFVGRRLAAEVDADEAPQGEGVIKRFLRRRIR